MNNRVGEEGYNNFGSKMIIIEYRKYADIDVYFPEYNWIYKNAKCGQFKNGLIKCPYEPRIYGKGYLGEGKYKVSINGKNIKCYDTWKSMLQRCYSPKYQEKYPTYIGCKVCDEWLNFQNFAKWYEENYYEVGDERMNLDKDILHKGNKIYSPQTCIFTSQRINMLFTKRTNERGKLPIGVCECKNGYIVQCRDGNGKKIPLGTFKTPHKAFLMYKINKELVIQSVANEYEDKIPNKLYEALINYEVEELD